MLGACPATLGTTLGKCSPKTIHKLLEIQGNEEAGVSSFGKFAGYRKKSASRYRKNTSAGLESVLIDP